MGFRQSIKVLSSSMGSTVMCLFPVLAANRVLVVREQLKVRHDLRDGLQFEL